MNSTRITLTPELKGRLSVGHKAAMDTVENWDLPTLAGGSVALNRERSTRKKRATRDGRHTAILERRGDEQIRLVGLIKDVGSVVVGVGLFASSYS